MKSKQFSGTLILLLTALIWGCAFVAQSEGSKSLEPFSFNAIRFLIGGFALLPAVFISDAVKKKKGTYKKTTEKEKKFLFLGGIACGFILSIATSLQQIGLDMGTEPGKAGFISALYILLVPIFGLFLGKRVPTRIWICIVFGIVGLYLLCVKDGSSVATSDVYVLLCAIGFSFHILLVDFLSPNVDGLKLSCLQFLVGGLITLVPMLIFETPTVTSIISAKWALLYTGLLSSGVGYTLQIIGQKYTPPTVASLVMSFESVFAVLAGMLMPDGALSVRELLGCTVMFSAIILAQIPIKKKSKAEG